MARIAYAPFTVEELTAGMIEATGLNADTVTAWVEALYRPDSVPARAGELGGAFDPTSDLPNNHAYLAAEFPSGNMVASARSLARMYAAAVSDVDGVRLLNPTTVETMTVVQTAHTRMHGLPPGLEVPADRSFSMSLGFWRACPPMPLVGPGSFGHPGSGGSIGFADLDAGVGFGYVPVVEHRRTAGQGPGRGGRCLPRVTDSAAAGLCPYLSVHTWRSKCLFDHGMRGQTDTRFWGEPPGRPIKTSRL